MGKRKAGQANGVGEAGCFVDKSLKKRSLHVGGSVMTWVEQIGKGLPFLDEEQSPKEQNWQTAHLNSI